MAQGIWWALWPICFLCSILICWGSFWFVRKVNLDRHFDLWSNENSRSQFYAIMNKSPLSNFFKKKCFIIPSYYPYSQTKNKKILCVMKLIKLNLLFYPNTQITHHLSFLLVMIIISFVGCELCRCALFSHDLLNEGLYIKKKKRITI